MTEAGEGVGEGEEYLVFNTRRRLWVGYGPGGVAYKRAKARTFCRRVALGYCTRKQSCIPVLKRDADHLWPTEGSLFE